MSIFKCKMCGGTLEINNNETVGVCEYCGTKQTLPRLDDDRKTNLYDRANHFRRNNDYDKAMSIYENILNEDKTDAEAYWSIVLCRYGIEYVEDPSTHKRVPTVNRAQLTSIYADEDYKSALEYADSVQKSIYEEEARAIDDIQKGILAISQKEEPFDVFICYKETDANGRRTPDSVLANDLYHQLKQEGFKVFFARITLEEKLGTAYEPYIFAALNSSKVMVVLGTKPEYFNAVWVKNEWSRYLALIRNGAKKILIPAYKDMDPYDLPEEFSHLQAQDMSKLGFMQDLIRGIKKIAVKDEPSQTVVKETVTVNTSDSVAPLLRRAFMFLEDGDWSSANEYCEKVLDKEPENAQAYVGKLMAELRVRKQNDLKKCSYPFNNKNNYQKAIRFAGSELKSELEGYIKFIIDRNENDRLESIYSNAKNTMESATDKDTFVKAAELFESIEEFKDSKELAKRCREKGEEAYRQARYDKAVSLFNNANNETDCESAKIIFEELGDYKDSKSYLDMYDDKLEEIRKNDIYNEATETKNKRAVLDKDQEILDLDKAAQLFESIADWKDAKNQAELCRKEIEKINAECLELERQAEIARKEAERKAKRNKKIAIITMPIVCAIIAFIIVLNAVIIPNGKYNDAIALMDAGRYTEAISAFEAMDGYKDSAYKINECNTAILDNKYNDALALMDAGKLDEAYSAFIELGDYKDASEKAGDIRLQKTKDQLKNIKVGSHINFGAYEQDNNTSNGKEDVEWLVLEIKDGKALVISKYALDCKQYNTSHTDVTWETSTLRKWLNNDFLNSAFSADEKAMIPTVTVSADKNPYYSTNPGNATQDQVFLLSIKEANKYFSSDSARQCKPTVYAVANGVSVHSSNGNCSWWLRSPGEIQREAAYVHYGGDVAEFGTIIDFDIDAVRPAMWIDINS